MPSAAPCSPGGAAGISPPSAPLIVPRRGLSGRGTRACRTCVLGGSVATKGPPTRQDISSSHVALVRENCYTPMHIGALCSCTDEKANPSRGGDAKSRGSLSRPGCRIGRHARGRGHDRRSRLLREQGGMPGVGPGLLRAFRPAGELVGPLLPSRAGGGVPRICAELRSSQVRRVATSASHLRSPPGVRRQRHQEAGLLRFPGREAVTHRDHRARTPYVPDRPRRSTPAAPGGHRRLPAEHVQCSGRPRRPLRRPRGGAGTPAGIGHLRA